MDVTSAFFNGFINEEVYMPQPPGFIDFSKPNHVYRLKKALYGLKQAPKAWYEEMVADLRYFNSLEHKVDTLKSQLETQVDTLEYEVDTLKSQLETQKTRFLNEIDRLSREYYYADHMNAILGIYTYLDEFTDLQCDYVETLEKCEHLEKELSK
ncbi:copia protein, partial [Tanacetum coccineum]